MHTISQVSRLLATMLPMLAGTALAQEDLVRGEDRIEVPATAEGLHLHNLFQDHMVLQRDKPLRIWGWATPGETVHLTFAGQSATAQTDERGDWSVTLEPLAASSEPRDLTVKGTDRRIVLEDLLVGDVWVLGGQSNMEFPISKVENGDLEIASANFPEIRMLTVPHLTDGTPRKNFPSMHQWSNWSKRHFRQGYWEVCSPDTVRDLSAIGYVFGRRLHLAGKVPIGLIDASIGGTTVEAWTSREAAGAVEDAETREMLGEWEAKVADFDPKADLEKRLADYEKRIADAKKQGRAIPDRWKRPTEELPGPVADRNRPGNCYEGLIAPLRGIQVRGAIFHQGYNNCFKGSKGARIYRKIFPVMIGAWRETLGDPQLPFGILSLCTAGQAQTAENFCEQMVDVGAEIREAQYSTFRQLVEAGDENIGFVSTYDLRRRWYHPQLKVPAGERIARWALATEYGFDRLRWMPPVLESVTARGGELHLKFNTTVMPVDDGSGMVGFAVAGDDRAYQMAEVRHLVTGKDDRGRPKEDRNVLVLSSPLVEEPLHFRYAWARNPMGNLQLSGNSDVPLATQRSDSWDIREGPVSTEGMNDRQAVNTMRKAMKAADAERLLHQARQRIGASTAE